MRKDPHPEYRVWRGMHSRCNNPNNVSWMNYGGRGIRVCERWKSFQTFISDMGPRPSQKHSLDRIDPEQGYSPENCRWATQKEQANNRRDSRLITHEDRTQTLALWAEEAGISHSLLSRRLKDGWSMDRALSPPTPPGQRSACEPSSGDESAVGIHAEGRSPRAIAREKAVVKSLAATLFSTHVEEMLKSIEQAGFVISGVDQTVSAWADGRGEVFLRFRFQAHPDD